MHTAAFFDAAAAIKLVAARTSAEHLHNGLISAQNLPLASLVLLIIALAELFAVRFSRSRASLLVFFSVIFLVSSFYIYPQNNYKDGAAVLAYGALLLALSTVGVSLLSRRAGVLSIFGAGLTIFLSLSVLGFVYTFSDPRPYDGRSRVDAAVVLGASVWGKDRPSPLLRGRLEAAMKLARSGMSRKIVVTGGTRRFGTIESEVEASYLKKEGIKDRDIIRDRASLSTPEQVDFVKQVLMDSLGMKKIVIVTDKWHLPRVLLMCRWQGAKVEGMPSDYKMFLPSELYYRARESAALQVYLFFGA